MKNVIFALLTALVVAIGIGACITDVDQANTGQIEEEIKGRGIVDCYNPILNQQCKECGHSYATRTCCDPYYELGCDVMCPQWVCDERGSNCFCKI